jgi:Kef-type K+ transport system membrane component KefB
VSVPGRTKTAGERLVEALALGLLVGGMVALARLPVAPADRWMLAARDLAAVGFFLLAGTLASSLLELLHLPHLTGFLLVGIVAGPHVLHAVDSSTVASLSVANSLALSLIALAGGAELRMESLRRGLRTLGWATVVQNGLALLLVPIAFVLARPLVPFTHGMDLGAVLAVALLWGVVALTRSPSAVMGILSQARPAGRLTDFTVGFVMTSDVVVVVLLALVVTLCRPLLDPAAAFSLATFRALGHEILGSVAIGTTLGLALAGYLRFVGRQILLVLLLIGLVLVEVIGYLRFEWLLTFLTAGFVVQNLSRQGGHLLHAIERTGEVVYVVFFATAGAHLDLPLVGQLWPAAVLFFAVRAGAAVVGARLSGALARDPPVLRRWGWAGLVSQAGLALGIASRLASEFPTFGAEFGALAIATVALNELVGPVLFKTALDRAGESGQGTEGQAGAADLRPPDATDAVGAPGGAPGSPGGGTA